MKILCHKQEYKYFKEYIDSLTFELFVYDKEELKEPGNYLCIRRIPKWIHPDSQISFLNTEQLSCHEKFNEYKETIKNIEKIYDYSLENIKISGKGIYLPYKESVEETKKLKEYLNVEKEYDLVVIGTASKRREQIINKLRQQGLKIHWITDLFGDERDKQIGKANILLNLHFSNNFEVFEMIRCNRWKWAGMKILSEPCKDVPEGISIVEIDKLYQKSLKMLGDKKLPPLKIGLCMIVKNESHIIHEVLQSSLKFIDTYCILDTGSTDNTIQIIKDFYKDKNIQGEVHESDWKGFGKSRSEALKLCDDKMDYILMIDADDLIEGPINSKEILLKCLSFNPNACNIFIKRGTIEYERTQIFKSKDSWRYEGVLHEFPTNDKPDNRMLRIPKEIYMIGRTLGARSLLEGNKYKRDAETILEELKNEPDNKRYMFYLAQSYRDAGMITEAIQWYHKRFEAGGWVEEQYICGLNLTRLLQSKEWAWKTHELCPFRNESLVSYMSFCRATSKWSFELLSMALYASSIPKPVGTFLFLENDSYEWKVWDELSIIASYCKQFEMAKKAYIKLLSDKNYPKEQEERIKHNFKQILLMMEQQPRTN